MKSIFYGIILGVLGAILGFMLSSGELTTYKKSQRDTAFPILALAFSSIGFIGGVILGSRISADENNNIRYGFNKLELLEGKNGRKWVKVSKWVYPETGNENSIITGFSEELNSIATTFNDVLIVNHNTKDGSNKSVSKMHSSSVYEIKKNIITGELICK